ncbi:hypothetical protein JCM4914_36160 [Streptomyces platensis subsp. malvinus]
MPHTHRPLDCAALCCAARSRAATAVHTCASAMTPAAFPPPPRCTASAGPKATTKPAPVSRAEDNHGIDDHTKPTQQLPQYDASRATPHWNPYEHVHQIQSATPETPETPRTQKAPDRENPGQGPSTCGGCGI